MNREKLLNNEKRKITQKFMNVLQPTSTVIKDFKDWITAILYDYDEYLGIPSIFHLIQKIYDSEFSTETRSNLLIDFYVKMGLEFKKGSKKMHWYKFMPLC